MKHTIFIFQNEAGLIKVDGMADVRKIEDRLLWAHIATVDAKACLFYVLNRHPELVKEVVANSLAKR